MSQRTRFMLSAFAGCVIVMVILQVIGYRPLTFGIPLLDKLTFFDHLAIGFVVMLPIAGVYFAIKHWRRGR